MKRKRKFNFLQFFRIILFTTIFMIIFVVVLLVFKQDTWDGKRRFTIAIDADPLILFSTEPQTKNATLMLIPTDTLLDVPYGYGQFLAQAVYKLGNLDKKRGGGMLLSKSLENTFGVVVDAYIANKSDNKFNFPKESDQIINFKKSYFSYTALLPTLIKLPKIATNLMTNFSLIDWVKFWMTVRNLRNDKMLILDLKDSGVLTNLKLPDNSDVNIVNTELFDELFGTKFQDQQVRIENISLEVVNATSREKVASQFSRILTKLGGNVVAVSTASQTENFGCRLIIFRPQFSSSIIVKRIEKFYKCSLIQQEQISISDIKIILGEEFIK